MRGTRDSLVTELGIVAHLGAHNVKTESQQAKIDAADCCVVACGSEQPINSAPLIHPGAMRANHTGAWLPDPEFRSAYLTEYAPFLSTEILSRVSTRSEL